MEENNNISEPTASYGQPLTFENVWLMFRETDKKFKETDEKFKETDKELKKLWAESDKRFEARLKKEAETREAERIKSKKELEVRLKKEAEDRERERIKSRKDLEVRLKKEAEKYEKERIISRKEFNTRLGEVTGTLGYFVEGMVEPRILEMFKARGIILTDVMHNIILHDKTGRIEAEIDLLLVNTKYSVAVEVKTTLTIAYIKDHLKRLNKLQANPKKFIKGTKLLGAVAGMRIRKGAEDFAIKNGLFVLKQKGEIMEVVNNNEFKPYEWIIKE